MHWKLWNGFIRIFVICRESRRYRRLRRMQSRLGCGVCQDYSHIMIALCQMSRIPARYVVGMLMGEGLSHAWVEIYDGGAWRGIDPTNHTIVGDQHH